MNPGYSDWSQVYSEVPSYIPQADLSYMIGRDMFQEFAPQLFSRLSRQDGGLSRSGGGIQPGFVPGREKPPARCCGMRTRSNFSTGW